LPELAGRHALLEVLPVEALAGHRYETLGYPTKKLYSVTGLSFLMEFHDWTRAQTADAHTPQDEGAALMRISPLRFVPAVFKDRGVKTPRRDPH